MNRAIGQGNDPMTPPDCWANGVAVRCFKCRKVLGNQNWLLCNVAPDAASGGTMMPFHRDCAPIMFHGPTFGPSVAEVAALRKDAERYRWLRENSVGSKPEVGILYWEGEESAWVSELDELDSLIDTRMNRVIEGKA